MNKAVLYFTQERWNEYTIDSIAEHYGKVIRVITKKLRKDLGDYFEIMYVYVC